MLTYTPGVAVKAEFTVPDGSGINVAGLTWTLALFKDGVQVTSGTEFDGLSIEGIGSPPTGYLMTFTPLSDGSTYLVRGTSSAADVWEERLEPKSLSVDGAPSYDQSTNVFRYGGGLMADGKLVNCASAIASLYRSDAQATVVKNLGAGTEGTLNWFAWTASAVSIIGGLNYFVRVTFTVAAPGSPAVPVTVVRDMGFLA